VPVDHIDDQMISSAKVYIPSNMPISFA